MLRTAGRWWYVLRYYRASQLAMRAVGRVRRWVPSFGLAAGRRDARLPGDFRVRGGPEQQTWVRARLSGALNEGSAARASALLRGEFTFLNQTRALPDPIDWQCLIAPETTRLWRFHLEYQEYLLDLALAAHATGEAKWLERAWSIVGQWIAQSRTDEAIAGGDAWHPYCISRRVPVWIVLLTLFPPQQGLRDEVLRSVAAQASFLARHLEWDLGGNHLLENARALVLAGAFFAGKDAEGWLRRGSELFSRQLDEQILPHGEHFERSPMYHAQMLEAVLDVRDATAVVLPELSGRCSLAGMAMAGFLGELLHPDGEIPLLGDSCLGQTPSPAGLIARANDGANGNGRHRVARSRGVPDALGRVVGDYWVFRHDRDFVVFDAGPVGPDHLPAHAHADLLGFEASVDGRRLFVDSGVFGYDDDPMRRYCRLSAAHNVLQIDGRDQCDMWSRFRMGYRGWPDGLEAGATHGFDWARSTHNAYRRYGVPVVGRWIACRPAGPWFIVNWAEGRGVHHLAGRLHLHPEVEAEQATADKVLLHCPGRTLRLSALAPGSMELGAGWYCPDFGRRERCTVVVWSTEAALPALAGWQLSWDLHEHEAALTRLPSGEVSLTWRQGPSRLRWNPVGKPLWSV